MPKKKKETTGKKKAFPPFDDTLKEQLHLAHAPEDVQEIIPVLYRFAMELGAASCLYSTDAKDKIDYVELSAQLRLCFVVMFLPDIGKEDPDIISMAFDLFLRRLRRCKFKNQIILKATAKQILKYNFTEMLINHRELLLGKEVDKTVAVCDEVTGEIYWATNKNAQAKREHGFRILAPLYVGTQHYQDNIKTYCKKNDEGTYFIPEALFGDKKLIGPSIDNLEHSFLFGAVIHTEVDVHQSEVEEHGQVL